MPLGRTGGRRHDRPADLFPRCYPMGRPAMLVAYSVRSGIAALNCVADAVPDDVPVRFVKTREDVVRAVAEARTAGRRPVVAWSFYSVDADAAAADLEAV